MGHWKTVRSPLSLRPGLVYLFSGRNGFDTVAVSPITVRRWSNDGGIFALNVRTVVGETYAHTDEHGGGGGDVSAQSDISPWNVREPRACVERVSALNAATTTKVARADHYHCVCARSDYGPRFRPVVHGTRLGGLHLYYRTAETRTSLFSKVRDIYFFVFNFPPVIVQHRVYTC